MQSILYPVFYCFFLERLGLALSESTQGGLCLGGMYESFVWLLLSVIQFGYIQFCLSKPRHVSALTLYSHNVLCVCVSFSCHRFSNIQAHSTLWPAILVGGRWGPSQQKGRQRWKISRSDNVSSIVYQQSSSLLWSLYWSILALKQNFLFYLYCDCYY